MSNYCPYHGWQCSGQCMMGKHAQQNMGHLNYAEYIRQLSELSISSHPEVVYPKVEEKKVDKRLLLLRRT